MANELNAQTLANFLIWCRNEQPTWTLSDISDTRAHGFAVLWLEFCQSEPEPEITAEPVHARRVEFCFLESHCHCGAWWQAGRFNLDLFDEGRWTRLFSRMGYSSIPEFLNDCME